MKPVAFEYVRPASIDDALAIARQNADAKFIAGGQSLGPMLNLRLSRPSLLIDIARLPELRHAEQTASGWLIGAATTHADIEDGRTPIGKNGMLPEVARQIAYRAIRNRGTIGGSLAHADAAADWPLALSTCGAAVLLKSTTGTRKVPVSDFLQSSFTTQLSNGEMLTAVEIPVPSRAPRWGYYKLCRKAGEFPIASAAIMIDTDRCRVFLGALSDRPRPMAGLAAEVGRSARLPAVSILAAAVGEAAPEIDSIDRRIFVTCVARAISQALNQ
jgi:aerobic carbon-monoxide dehydrogenase medium subunit